MIAEATLALRLLGVALILFLAPGFALLTCLRVPATLAERAVLSFAIGYGWILALSVVLPALHLTVDYAGALTVLLVIGLGIRMRLATRPPAERPRLSKSDMLAGIALAAVVIACAVAAWFIEPPVTGEEALDLASIQRFADGGAITFENTSLLPDTTPVYVFQPYQLALGVISRWAQVDPLVAFVKIRPILVFFSLTFVFALIEQLTRSRARAMAAFTVVLAFVMLNVETWEASSLFPLVRRGGFSAGVCIPALMTLIVMATRRAGGETERRRRTAAIAAIAALSVATLSTHPLEMFTFLCFAAAVLVTVLVGLDPAGDRRAALASAGVLAVAVGGFLVLHSRAVPDVARFEAGQKELVRAELVKLSANLPALVAGEMREEGNDLLAGDIPETIVGVIGVPALVAAAFVAPAGSAILALAIVPLALAYASPGGVLMLSLLTSPDTVQDVTAYFALLGLVGLGIGLTAVASWALTLNVRGLPPIAARALPAIAAAAVLFAAWKWRVAGVAWLISLAKAHPDRFVLMAVASAVLALAVVVMRRARVSAEPRHVLALPALTAALSVVLALGSSAAEQTLPARVKSARAAPSVLNWPADHDVLRASIRPSVPVPRAVVDELRLKIPPRSVVAADPRYSCGLVVLLDAYCVNPESIYGHFFLSARGYQDNFVHSIDGQDADWHPFFNAVWPPEEGERTFITQYRVRYLLADPARAELIERKLTELTIAAHVEMRRDGYVLYRLNEP